MPKLILPKTRGSGTVEVHEYDNASPRHLRALARYLYTSVHEQTTRALIKSLIPGIEEDQVSNIIFIRLKNLSQMTVEQAEEEIYGEKGD